MCFENYSAGPINNRYSAKASTRDINFMLLAPEAQKVFIIGDFNQWKVGANPMNRLPDGGWIARVPMHHGHHQYLFLVDGQATLDPKAQGVARHEQHQRVSLMSVS